MQTEQTAQEIAHSRAVRDMFSGIARRYDLLNHLLSMNVDKRWRRLVRAELQDILDRPDAVVLDAACGTGDLAIELRSHSKARVVGTDFCRPMLAIAKDKSHDTIPYVEGDAMRLPFDENTFSAVTIAFGLRNLPNFRNGLLEFHRVLKPGGRLAILEFSSPVVPGFRSVFNFYFTQVLPRIGGVVSGSRVAYEYLPDSVSKFPDQRGLAKMMSSVGFSSIECTNLTGGIAACHRGTK